MQTPENRPGICITDIWLKRLDTSHICAAGECQDCELQHETRQASHRRNSLPVRSLRRFRALAGTLVLAKPYSAQLPIN